MPKRSQWDQSGEPEYIPLDDPNTYWYSYDLGCCAALLSAGFKLVTLDRTTPRKVQFIVQREKGLETTVSAYWAGKLSVDARGYFDTLRMLKNRLHSSEAYSAPAERREL